MHKKENRETISKKGEGYIFISITRRKCWIFNINKKTEGKNNLDYEKFLLTVNNDVIPK